MGRWRRGCWGFEPGGTKEGYCHLTEGIQGEEQVLVTQNDSLDIYMCSAYHPDALNVKHLSVILGKWVWNLQVRLGLDI